MLKNRMNVFDYDGTIEFKGEVSIDNLNFIDSIKCKALNTSRSFEEIPDFILKRFEYIMTLSGSFFYRNGTLIKKYEKISDVLLGSIVDFATKNQYNIAFNNTKTRFYNVKNEESKTFMDSNGMIHSDDLVIPDEVYQVTVTSNSYVKDYPGTRRQSERVIELSVNSKANIAKHFGNYVAYGDNDNDIPMFDYADKYYRVKDGLLNVAE